MTVTHEFRPDIQGLRALAMSAVALFHAGVPMFAGGYVGVDIFFVISGFLITGLLVREVERSGRVSFAAFYARRIRRLLPAALVVLAATTIAVYVLLSPLEQRELIRPLLASALYASNFWFATQATDYLGGDLHANPVLHTWSLAVEEQFYLVWPLLILLAARAGTAEGLRQRLAAVMIAVFTISLAMCIWLTQTSQPWAFFASPARAWEFAAGGLAYLVGGRFTRLSGRKQDLLAIIGLALMLAAIFAYGAATRFPGVAALVPVAGAVFIIVAGTGQGGRMHKVFGCRAAQVVGNLSYSWYLWHWPALVFPALLMGPLNLSERLLWVTASLGLAALTYYTVENRIRFSAVLSLTPARGLALGGTLTAAAILGVLVVRGTATSALAFPPQADFVAARASLPAIYSDGCHLKYKDVSFPACTYGDPEANRTIVLYGDSHAAHWFPALERIALDAGWRLVSLTKSACPAVDVDLFNTALARPYHECNAWRAGVLARVAKDRPALVVIASSEAYVHDPQQNVDVFAWQTGMEKTLSQLRATGSGVVVLQDTPRPGIDIPVCLSRSAWRNSGDACNFARARPDAEIKDAERTAAATTDRVLLVDLSDLLCDDARCLAVVDGRVAYRDNNHLSTKISRWMAPTLRARIDMTFPELRPVEVADQRKRRGSDACTFVDPVSGDLKCASR